MPESFDLGRNEMLKSKKLIDNLFASGRKFSQFPCRIVFQLQSQDLETPVVRIGVSASKKHFKRAVDRNRIKRLLREAYRLQKNDLIGVLQAKNLCASVFFLYNERELPGFDVVYAAVGKALARINKSSEQFSETAI